MSTTKITVNNNGSLRVEGDFEIVDKNGNQYDLAGDFKELDFYRNENNTGPIIRIYAVSVADTLYKEMVAYGNLQPHTKYGTTKIYFFRNRLPKAINIIGAEPCFDQKFNRYCIGVYEKNGMGNVSFLRGL